MLSSVFLAWAVIRQNLPGPVVAGWPWKLQVLDVQSATTAVTIAGGFILARAQFATSVRPMISWSGWVVKTTGYSSKLIWLVRVSNSSGTAAYFRADGYHVILRNRGAAATDEDPPWVTRDEAIALLRTSGLRYRIDYDLNHFGPSVPLSLSNGEPMLALFTPKAMGIIEDILIQVRARDLAGDVHERVIYCMRGAERNPRHADHVP